jgi:hypothetical protein
MSFDLREEYGNTSYVKFGGYDTFAIKNKDISNLRLFKTRDLTSWSVPFKYLLARDTVPLSLPGVQFLDFDPSVPYIYVPARKLTYEGVIKPIEMDIGMDGLNGTNLNSDVYYFNKTCTEIKAQVEKKGSYLRF